MEVPTGTDWPVGTDRALATDRIAALEAEIARLTASESLYRTATLISGRMAWAADAGGAVIAMPEPFATVTGLGEEEAMGDGWLRIVHAEDLADVERAWRAALGSGRRYDHQFRARMADGTYRLMRARAIPMRGEGGRIINWIGTAEDIEDSRQGEQARRDAEERLRQSEELHRYTIELSQQMVFTSGTDGRILSISPRFWEIS